MNHRKTIIHSHILLIYNITNIISNCFNIFILIFNEKLTDSFLILCKFTEKQENI